jgi:hypothetical protein
MVGFLTSVDRTFLLSLVGTLTGITGTVLGILNHMRDRPTATVTLQWDMTVTDGTRDPSKLWGLVRVTNTGRRSLHLSAVALQLPKGCRERPFLLLKDSMQGYTLHEASKPAGFTVDQDQMKEYASLWNKIRAYAESSTGKVYRSKCPRQRPSWAA